MENNGASSQELQSAAKNAKSAAKGAKKAAKAAVKGVKMTARIAGIIATIGSPFIIVAVVAAALLIGVVGNVGTHKLPLEDVVPRDIPGIMADMAAGHDNMKERMSEYTQLTNEISMEDKEKAVNAAIADAKVNGYGFDEEMVRSHVVYEDSASLGITDISFNMGKSGVYDGSDIVSWAISVAADDTVGYDWGRRKCHLCGGQKDYDCSSFVVAALAHGFGSPIFEKHCVNADVTTHNMALFLPLAGFRNLGSTDQVEEMPGDILLRGSHVEIYVGGGQTVGAHHADGGGVYGTVGDQNGDEISVVKMWGSYSSVWRCGNGVVNAKGETYEQAKTAAGAAKTTTDTDKKEDDSESKKSGSIKETVGSVIQTWNIPADIPGGSSRNQTAFSVTANRDQGGNIWYSTVGRWSPGTPQNTLYESGNVYKDDFGFLRVKQGTDRSNDEDPYIIALAGGFDNNIGSKYRLTFDKNGEKVEMICIVGDQKNSSETDAYDHFHPDGSIIEFEVDADAFFNKYGRRNPGSWPGAPTENAKLVKMELIEGEFVNNTASTVNLQGMQLVAAYSVSLANLQLKMKPKTRTQPLPGTSGATITYIAGYTIYDKDGNELDIKTKPVEGEDGRKYDSPDLKGYYVKLLKEYVKKHPLYECYWETDADGNIAVKEETYEEEYEENIVEKIFVEDPVEDVKSSLSEANGKKDDAKGGIISLARDQVKGATDTEKAAPAAASGHYEEKTHTETRTRTVTKKYGILHVKQRPIDVIAEEAFEVDPNGIYVAGDGRITNREAIDSLTKSTAALVYDAQIGEASNSIYKTDLSGEFAFPIPGKTIADVTSNFGPRIAPTAGASSFHNGIDISAEGNMPIIAIKDGVVKTAESSSVRGNYVKIDHGGGIESLSQHMSEIKVKPGQAVKKGQVIGLTGATGVATGEHLHFEIHVNGTPTDPLPYIKAGKKAE